MKWCFYCGLPADQTDHIIPRSIGGPNKKWNKVPVCKGCNRKKSDRFPSEWLGDDVTVTILRKEIDAIFHLLGIHLRRFYGSGYGGIASRIRQGLPPATLCSKCKCLDRSRKVVSSIDPVMLICLDCYKSPEEKAVFAEQRKVKNKRSALAAKFRKEKMRKEYQDYILSGGWKP